MNPITPTHHDSPPRLMAHIIPCYPDYESSLRAAHSIIDAGVSLLELQFPFSDPAADGSTIQTACTDALANGFTVEKGFEFIEALQSRVPIFVMTYANIIYTKGIEQFVQRCQKLGVKGLIIPDLPLDSDEGLGAFCKDADMERVPLTLVGATASRLELLHSIKSSYVYVSLRKGITGRYTELGESDIQFLQSIRRGDTQIIAGFGIRDPKQVCYLAPYTDIVVVGSAIVECIRDFGADSPELISFITKILQECKKDIIPSKRTL